ncbi:hypothetical protein HDU87_007032 [Geranomyces variabilis]|uniref:Uncharacterized protein n=1 Tax=Geranomyces variabilis TaxID=109894 RepID=A0AAD5TFV0_9FUNG|nr:hypothetical protein HDU87_007032 [Geranomyces variabilis]
MSSPPLTRWGPPYPNQSSRPIVKLSAVRKSAWRFATSSAATAPPRPTPASAPPVPKTEPAATKNADDNKPLTRWGPAPEAAADDEPSTRWGAPEPPKPQEGPSNRYLNITTGPAGIQYSVGHAYAQNKNTDSANDAAVAASAEWDGGSNANGEGEQEASDEETVGWDDTVFLPVDITIESLMDNLLEIAEEHRVSIDYKENTLRIRADTQEQLCAA